MPHLPILPLVVPLLGAILLLLPPLRSSPRGQRGTALLVLGVTVAAGTLLMDAAMGRTMLYVLGNWTPPFGIVLMADPLAALLVTLASFLGLVSLLYAGGGGDGESDDHGEYFHSLVLFQVTGINGAFLTGDIFNLFVFFEVLLISSYALLALGRGADNSRAGFHYVTLNLLGSAFFLIALGMVYGTLGTLNMADMAQRLAALDPERAALAKAACLLLMVVFGLKAALVPLHFWLARTYAVAIAPVAALFAVMTKVGIYSLLRVHAQVFDGLAGIEQWAPLLLWPVGLLTVLVGSLGVLASTRLKTLTAHLVVVSAGSLILTVALWREEATAAGLFYLVHSTLVTAALFFIADMVGRRRGVFADSLLTGPHVASGSSPETARKWPEAGLFFLAAVVVIGMPPLSGFVGKVLLLLAADSPLERAGLWPVVLGSSLCVLVAMVRAGIVLFWEPLPGGDAAPLPVRDAAPGSPSRMRGLAVGLLLSGSVLLVVFGARVTDYAALAAARLHAPVQVEAVVLEESRR